MPPLIELPLQSRRPSKVYGRRRVLAETREIHRQLFGTDENDENRIAKSLAQLSLPSKHVPQPVNNEVPLSLSSLPPPRHVLSQTVSQPSPSNTPQRLPTPSIAPTTKDPRSKSLRMKYSHAVSCIALSPSEERQLQPLLSQPNVHSQVVSFPSFAMRLLSKFDVSKSGEGSFSECLLLKHKTNPSDVAILKIIPFDLSEPPSDTAAPSGSLESTISNSTVEAVLREVQILSALAPHHGFAQLRSCQVVRGKWHDGFLDAYHAFREARPDLAINPLPSERWDENMIYGVIEMDNAGNDLESLTKPSAFQVYDAFWMSVVLLAVVEKECEFEHRDLHMSNICFQARVAGVGYDIGPSIVKKMASEPQVMLGLTNLKITVIDYTMSRLRMQGQTRDEGQVLFNPESAWSGTSCDDSGHQILTGQRMRSLALARAQLEPLPDSQDNALGSNKWSSHIPQANIFWLAHLLYQLLQQAGAPPRQVAGSSAFAKKLQTRMWKQMREVLAFVDRHDPSVGSTVDFLSLAIENGWLRQQDVEGFKRTLNDET